MSVRSSQWRYELNEASHAFTCNLPPWQTALLALGRRCNEKCRQWGANASSVSRSNGLPKLEITQPPILNAWEKSLHDATPSQHAHSLYTRQITCKAGCMAAYALSRAYGRAQPQPRHAPTYPSLRYGALRALNRVTTSSLPSHSFPLLTR